MQVLEGFAMTEKNKPNEIRSQILHALYAERTSPRVQALDRDDLAKQLNQSPDEIQREVVYLEEKGYIVTRERKMGVRIFCTLQLRLSNNGESALF